MLEFAWLVLCALVIILLYPVGYLCGYARGRRAKVLTAIRELLRGEDDGRGGQASP